MNVNHYPKVYLAVDNCFASKRWTRPDDWARVIRSLGVTYIEASADTELDPLFMGREYLKRWVEATKEAEVKHGVKVANLYSGHGTYSTLGLAHTDKEVRRRMIDHWFKPLIDTAVSLGAGMGFFAHAFPDHVLQDYKLYDSYIEILYSGLAELNAYALEVGCGELGVEQMYSPHQVPWRIEGTRDLLRKVSERSGRSFYFTEDTGHHHTKFNYPSLSAVQDAVKKYVESGEASSIWLGTEKSYELMRACKSTEEAVLNRTVEAIMNEVEENPQMFSAKEDNDCYEWLSQIGCYSPIVHLQQTDGLSSSHAHFTEENNEKGIIDGDKLLTSIKKSYDMNQEEGMPAKCKKIYLTMEAFASTASFNEQTLKDYAESIEYWRKYIPEDGLPLDQLVKEENE